MTSTNSNQKYNYLNLNFLKGIKSKRKKDEHPEIITPGAGTFVIWIKEKFVSLIGSTSQRDGQPKKKTGAGTFVTRPKKKIASLTASTSQRDGHPKTPTPGAGTSQNGQPKKKIASFIASTSQKPGHPDNTSGAGTP